jgi:TolA-binding protein
MDSLAKKFSRSSSLEANTESVEDYQEYIQDFSNVLDQRITEINDQLQESKRQLIDLLIQDLNQQNILQVNLKDLHYNVFSQEENYGLDSISKLKKFKEYLDTYLSKVDNYLDLKENFAKSNLKDLIRIKNNKFEFTKYKLGAGRKGLLSDVVWAPTQHRQNFTLSDSGKTMKIIYQSCYELYVSQDVLETGVNIIRLEADCITTNNYHSIGLVNESYIYGVNCVCLKSQNCFMFDKGGNVFCNNVSTITTINFLDGEKHEFEIEVNLKSEEDKFMKIKLKEQEYGPYKLIGKTFKLAVGMCNGGNAIYRILD